MPNDLNDRERAILKMALSYANANIDDVREAFAHWNEDDPDNEAGKCSIGDDVIDPPDEKDFQRIVKKLGLGEL